MVSWQYLEHLNVLEYILGVKHAGGRNADVRKSIFHLVSFKRIKMNVSVNGALSTDHDIICNRSWQLAVYGPLPFSLICSLVLKDLSFIFINFKTLTAVNVPQWTLSPGIFKANSDFG